jgi:hypothetical protein
MKTRDGYCSKSKKENMVEVIGQDTAGLVFMQDFIRRV